LISGSGYLSAGRDATHCSLASVAVFGESSRLRLDYQPQASTTAQGEVLLHRCLQLLEVNTPDRLFSVMPMSVKIFRLSKNRLVSSAFLRNRT